MAGFREPSLAEQQSAAEKGRTRGEYQGVAIGDRKGWKVSCRTARLSSSQPIVERDRMGHLVAELPWMAANLEVVPAGSSAQDSATNSRRLTASIID